jgi:hypothetical protein
MACNGKIFWAPINSRAFETARTVSVAMATPRQPFALIHKSNGRTINQRGAAAGETRGRSNIFSSPFGDNEN